MTNNTPGIMTKHKSYHEKKNRKKSKETVLCKQYYEDSKEKSQKMNQDCYRKLPEKENK